MNSVSFHSIFLPSQTVPLRIKFLFYFLKFYYYYFGLSTKDSLPISANLQGKKQPS